MFYMNEEGNFIHGFRKDGRPIIKVGDAISIFVNDDDLYNWVMQYEGKLIVECVEYYTNLVWVENCEYAISIDDIFEVCANID